MFCIDIRVAASSVRTTHAGSVV